MTTTNELQNLREENARLRAAAQRVAKVNEEHAQLAWEISMQLLKQVQRENEQCAYWFVSALSKLTQTHPNRPVIEVLAMARTAMPVAARQYNAYVKEKC
jgi:hypothetical protein